jgi:hypothetical protein
MFINMLESLWITAMKLSEDTCWMGHRWDRGLTVLSTTGAMLQVAV